MRPLLAFAIVVASWLSCLDLEALAFAFCFGILDSVQFVAKVALRKELLVVFVLET